MRKRLIQTLLAVFLISSIPFISSTKVSAATPDEIATFAEKFYGTPYKFGGTTPSGFDCSGYIQYVFNNFNISVPRTSEDQFKVGTSISKENLKPGDLVFFANTYKKGISHTGIYLGNNKFISAKSRGVLKANLKTDPYWAPKYAGAKRVTTNIKVAFDPVQVKQDEQMSEVFKDLSVKHPAYEAIIALHEIGVINGYEDSTFKPERSITRGQAAAMINRKLKLKASTQVTFTDVKPNHQYAADIAALNEAGIFQGYETGEFGINDKLTRAHLAAIVDRAFDLQGKIGGEVQVASKYTDVPSSHWAADVIHALKTLDQTTVFQTTEFNIGKEATRAEFSAAIYSAISAK
ncbi:C40 family peptidase [Sporosarcina sp. Marseille-Q4943]|uniref:C40 family peptidase n=1 Tax=Sporosarcina sp. Marseille-Q4943 TaxID=2942204 RepID=UPI00208DA438|nr:C40 family peptidase [Sporosarcina sp. Marseille-Q4943]